MRKSALVLVSVVLAACGSNHVALPGNELLLDDVVGTLPVPAHSVSSSQTIPGDSPAQKSLLGTSPAPLQALEINSGANTFAWAIYTHGLANDHYPTGLHIDISDVVGEYWIGLADYSSNHWRWHGPFNFGGARSISPWTNGADYLSSLQTMAWAVITSKGSSATVNFSTVSTDLYTWIDSPGLGEQLVRLTSPQSPRFAGWAPVVVQVNAWVMEPAGFTAPLRVQQLGAVQLSYLWPGTVDATSGLASAGVFDYGGESCQAALRDVLKFAAGLLTDIQGRTIDAILPVDVSLDNVGLNSFSHPGIMATNTLAMHGADLPAGIWFVGGENPTNEQILTKEIGVWVSQQASVNPAYDYPADYTPAGLLLDYASVEWIEDAQHQPGRPVFTHPTLDDFVMHDVTPEMWGKRYFSSAICRALLDNGVFTEETWPAGVATLTEARAVWPLRSCVGADPVDHTSWNHYADVPADTKVMLLFAVSDHMQPHADKPHIHMAYDGFHHEAGCWVRLNPDRSYVQAQFPGYSGPSPDNPANDEPADWLNAENWAHPNDLDAKEEVALAAIAEMVDRTHYNAWSDNLPAVLP